jgi:hypothetical protein
MNCLFSTCRLTLLSHKLCSSRFGSDGGRNTCLQFICAYRILRFFLGVDSSITKYSKSTPSIEPRTRLWNFYD